MMLVILFLDKINIGGLWKVSTSAKKLFLLQKQSSEKMQVKKNFEIWTYNVIWIK